MSRSSTTNSISKNANSGVTNDTELCALCVLREPVFVFPRINTSKQEVC
jgi:hypothetical protein